MEAYQHTDEIQVCGITPVYGFLLDFEEWRRVWWGVQKSYIGTDPTLLYYEMRIFFHHCLFEQFILPLKKWGPVYES